MCYTFESSHLHQDDQNAPAARPSDGRPSDAALVVGLTAEQKDGLGVGGAWAVFLFGVGVPPRWPPLGDALRVAIARWSMRGRCGGSGGN